MVATLSFWREMTRKQKRGQFLMEKAEWWHAEKKRAEKSFGAWKIACGERLVLKNKVETALCETRRRLLASYFKVSIPLSLLLSPKGKDAPKIDMGP